MKAMIVGKRRSKGVARATGEAYDKTYVHVTHKAAGIEGLAVATLGIKASMYSPDEIVVGRYCEFDRDERGFLCNFEMVPNK